MINTSWSEASATLSTHRTRKVENNTKLVCLDNGDIAVRLHDTDVVTYRRGEPRIMLDTGQWYTNVTADRIRSFTPTDLRLSSSKGPVARWMLSTWVDGTHQDPFPFVDGIELERDANGRWRAFAGGLSADDLAVQDAWNLRITKMIRDYLKDYQEPWRHDDPISCPACWKDAPMFDPSSLSTLSTGDILGDRQHLVQHLLHRHYLPELTRNALEDQGILYFTRTTTPRRQRALRAYFRQRLLLGAVGGKGGRRPMGEGPWRAMQQVRVLEART